MKLKYLSIYIYSCPSLQPAFFPTYVQLLIPFRNASRTAENSRMQIPLHINSIRLTAVYPMYIYVYIYGIYIYDNARDVHDNPPHARMHITQVYVHKYMYISICMYIYQKGVFIFLCNT